MEDINLPRIIRSPKSKIKRISKFNMLLVKEFLTKYKNYCFIETIYYGEDLKVAQYKEVDKFSIFNSNDFETIYEDLTYYLMIYKGLLLKVMKTIINLEKFLKDSPVGYQIAYLFDEDRCKFYLEKDTINALSTRIITVDALFARDFLDMGYNIINKDNNCILFDKPTKLIIEQNPFSFRYCLKQPIHIIETALNLDTNNINFIHNIEDVYYILNKVARRDYKSSMNELHVYLISLNQSKKIDIIVYILKKILDTQIHKVNSVQFYKKYLKDLYLNIKSVAEECIENLDIEDSDKVLTDPDIINNFIYYNKYYKQFFYSDERNKFLDVYEMLNIFICLILLD